MKPEPIDLQNIGKVYHNENEAVHDEENYEDETKEENLCCRQVKRGEVYFADYYYDDGILADKRKPAVIVSNHGINEKAPFVKVVYLTTAPKSNHPAHVKVQCENPALLSVKKARRSQKVFWKITSEHLQKKKCFRSIEEFK